jgi:hypothetical protein
VSTDVRAKKLHLANTDFDTGKMTYAGEYALSDKAYARLLDRLASNNFEKITPELRQNILGFYRDPEAPVSTKKNEAAWEKTRDQVQRLKAFAPQANSLQISEAP